MPRPTPTDYWKYLAAIVRGLLAWGLGSVAVGALVGATARSPFWRQWGGQQAAWGAVDALLALAGRGNVQRQLAAAQAGRWQGDLRREARRLWWILAINSALDVGYLAGATWLLRQPHEGRRGMGAGILVQGGFLLLWDVFHSLAIGSRFLSDVGPDE